MVQISLIIPLYNAEKYLRACLDSVANQSFRDFEAVLVNDGSTDATAEIAAEYAENYACFRLINQPNAGVSAARNTGINSSDAPFFALLDQDDVLHPQALESLYSAIVRTNADVAAFDIETVAENFVLTAPNKYAVENLPIELLTSPADSFFADKKGASILVWNKLYRRSAMQNILFPLGVQPAEDTVFTLKTLFRVQNVAWIKAPFLFYRRSDTSVMKQGITEKYIRSHALAAKEMWRYFFAEDVCKLSQKNRKRMRFYLSRFIFKSLISQPLRRTGKGTEQAAKLALAHSLVSELAAENAPDFSLLGWRKALACRLFLAKHYFAAALLV